MWKSHTKSTDPKKDRSVGRGGGRSLKGLLSTKSKGNETDKHLVPHRSATDDLEATHSSRRKQNTFLPNPEIPSSPLSNSSDKKIWEGAYHNFLSGRDSSPDTKETAVEPLSPQAKTSFSVIPGTKRLVAPREGSFGALAQGSNSATNLEIMGNGEPPRRSSSFLRSMFNKSTSDRSMSMSRRSRNQSSGSDDLDAAMRHGVNKHSPEYSNLPRKQASPPMPSSTPLPMPHLRTTSQEDISSGLDALLAAGDSSGSPHYKVETANFSRISSYGSIPPIMGGNPQGITGIHPYYLTKRDSTGSLNYYQTGLNLDGDSSTSSEAHNGRSKSIELPSTQQLDQSPIRPVAGGIGSLMEQNGSEHTETHLYRQRNHPQHHTMHPSYIGRASTPHQLSCQRNGTSIENLPRVGVDSNVQFGDSSNQSTSSSLSNSATYEQSFGTTPQTADPQQKKMFTSFHNHARYAQDSTSAFLGSEGTPSPIHSDVYLAQRTLVATTGFSLPFQAYSTNDLHALGGSFSTSLPPLETVDEHNISIHKSMRMLKPIKGTESWEFGRRYLIAPAALAACPLTVINRLAGGLVQSAKETIESSSPQAYGSILLGECLMTYTGETHHLSLGQWSSCKLVLRQNYLLEFDSSAPITSIPRGYIHLQHAIAHTHIDFQNSLELEFFASPCAKTDRRTLMIRTDTREECTYWVKCLNRAAGLKMEDLWDSAPNMEMGHGRYASIHPARRKNADYFTKCHVNEVQEGGELQQNKTSPLVEYDSALKIIDKAEFWRRVVKGKERADTLVRETSVQAALTAKCGNIGTFLRLKGFFETSEHVVIELELLRGTDLFKHISSKGTLDENEAATILRDILLSLDAMNRVGLAHRDIKPANILMCDKEKHGVSVKVCDFGMSTFVAVDGLVRGRCGTPGFVAPEILVNGSRQGYSNEVDVFSAGITVYVMLCGYEPFYGENEKQLIEANRQAKIDFPEADWGEISDDARDLIMKMTESDPRQRISANDALMHPWIRGLEVSDDGARSKKVEPKRQLALSASDVPQEGACVIS